MVSEESVEGSDKGLVFAQTEEGAVAPQHIRLRHRERHAGLAWVTENEFARLDGTPLTGQRIDAAALDRRLANAVLVAERIEVPRLAAEVLGPHDFKAAHSMVLPPRQLHGAAPLLFGVAEDADREVDLPAAKRLVPVLRIVLPAVKKLLGATRHADPKCLGKALQRLLWHPQCHQAGIADGD